MRCKARDKWSFLTHFFALLLAVDSAVCILLMKSYLPINKYLSLVIFCVSMIVLYAASAAYHYCSEDPEKIKRLRKLDHSMIFVLIAGTYTPIMYNGLEYPKSLIFLIILWALVVCGVLMKLFWLSAPRWLYTLIYVVMGWSIAIDWKALTGLPTGTLLFLLLGGLSYTVGAVFYVIKKPNFVEDFGFHELFHLFIIGGTVLHFIGITVYLV